MDLVIIKNVKSFGINDKAFSDNLKIARIKFALMVEKLGLETLNRKDC